MFPFFPTPFDNFIYIVVFLLLYFSFIKDLFRDKTEKIPLFVCLFAILCVCKLSDCYCIWPAFFFQMALKLK